MTSYTPALFLPISAILILAISGCSPALPQHSLPEEVIHYAAQAEASAAEAREHAAEAQELFEMSRRLFQEAEKLGARADSAREYCEAIQKKIPKQRVVYIEKKVPVRAADSEDEEAETEPAEGGKGETKETWPKYSPSDAPLSKKRDPS